MTIDASRLVDEASFHAVFAEAFGFPGFYGRNWDAWNDCMGSLDEPDSGLTEVICAPGRVVTLVLENATEFREKRRDLYDALVECSAFVNWRRVTAGYPPVLVLAFYA
ncbi:MAG: barstar family protein [Sandaracinus sp.]|nr:barstar family protein [Sandaracinus sp.]MCB9612777.1 barstar family protein [Sandaracinus sp.]MCB9618240.1 barstar family protein [Sandaracinus sp.]MCB9636917.1 barstar family protein [Sandaracinus sp.]